MRRETKVPRGEIIIFFVSKNFFLFSSTSRAKFPKKPVKVSPWQYDSTVSCLIASVPRERKGAIETGQRGEEVCCVVWLERKRRKSRGKRDKTRPLCLLFLLWGANSSLVSILPFILRVVFNSCYQYH